MTGSPPAGRPTGRLNAADATPHVGAGAVAGCAPDASCVFHEHSAGDPTGHGADLTPRDLLVLRSLAGLRLMTGRHVERLHFRHGSPVTQARRARAVLQRLHALGLVDRLDRRIGGVRSGSAGFVYRLTAKGRRALGLRRRNRPRSSAAFQDHILAVTELAVTLHDAHRARHLDLIEFQAEPASWRTWTGPAGERLHIRPDAFAIVAVGDYEHLWFVEVDRGTEPHTTIRRKVDAYRTYATSGTEQRRHGVFPRVAFLATSDTGRAALDRALARTRDTTGLVTVAHLDDAVDALTDQPAERP
jgi:hypothetical protein